MVRRAVTGLTPAGKSTTVYDGPALTVWKNPSTAERGIGAERVPSADALPPVGPGEIMLEELWATRSIPPEAGPEDPTATMTEYLHDEFPPGGTRCRVISYGANRRSPFHTTSTLDYLVLLEGEMTLLLEESEVTLRPGDCMVMTGVVHGWRVGPEGSKLFAVQVGL